MHRLFIKEVRIVEIVSAIFAMLWGTWFVVGMVDYARPAFAVMASLAPYWLWGGTIALCGATHAFALFTERRWLRRRCLRALFVCWLAVGLALGLPNIYSSGFFTYFYIAIIHAIFYIRLVRRDGDRW